MNRSRRQLLYQISLGMIAVYVCAGCSSVRVRTNAYLNDLPFPAAATGSTVYIEASGEDQPALLAAEVIRAVSAELGRRGYVHVENPTEADYVLTCVFGIDGGQMQSRTVPRTTGTRWSTYVYGRHGHGRFVTGYGTSTYYTREFYREYDRYLRMTLIDRALFDAATDNERDAAIVWQADSSSSGGSTDLRRILRYLLAATFEHFGEDTGGQQGHWYHKGSERPKDFVTGGPSL